MGDCKTARYVLLVTHRGSN